MQKYVSKFSGLLLICLILFIFANYFFADYTYLVNCVQQKILSLYFFGYAITLFQRISIKSLLFWVSSLELNIWNKKVFKKFSSENQIPLARCVFEFEKCERFIVVEHRLNMNVISHYCVIKADYILISFFSRNNA